MTGEADDDGAGRQRLDKWLWFARIAKSRTLAATFVTDGKIRVNRERVSRPAQLVKVGDVITSKVQRTIRILKIVDLGKRRGPAQEARGLYEDLTPPPVSASGDTPAEPASTPSGDRDPGMGRPTKRDRRLIDKMRGR